MSAFGQKQTLDWRPLMSALPPKADIAEHCRHARYVSNNGPLALHRTAALLSANVVA
jgi:hypothetical protein